MTAQLRKQPYPYRVMVGISSDADISQGMGGLFGPDYCAARVRQFRSVGLDASSSFFMVDDEGQMLTVGNRANAAYWYRWGYPQPRSYIAGDVWNVPDAATLAKVDKYIKCGWFDALHSFGSFHLDTVLGYSDTNGQRAWFAEYMAKWRELGWGRFANSWIDHKNNARDYYEPGTPPVDSQNRVDFAPGYRINYAGAVSRVDGAQGDLPTDPWYHTDLSVGRDAVRFIWNAEQSAVSASDLDYMGYDDADTLLGETGVGPSGRYNRGFTSQNLLEPVNLRDGRKAWGFTRVLKWAVDDNSIEAQLAWFSRAFEDAKTEGGFALLYGHLAYEAYDGGYVFGSPYYRNGDSHDYSWFAEKQAAGEMLWARQSRMLDYALARGPVSGNRTWGVQWYEALGSLYITHVKDPQLGDFVPELRQLRGITWLVDDPDTQLILGHDAISETEISRNWDAAAGKWAVGVKWFESDTTDYTALSTAQVAALFDATTAPTYAPYEGREFDLAASFNEAAQPVSGAAGSTSGVSGTVTEKETASGAAGSTSAAAGAVIEKEQAAGAVGSRSDVAGEVALAGSALAFDLAAAFYASASGATGAVASDSAVSGDVSAVHPVGGAVESGTGVQGAVDEIEQATGAVASGSAAAGGARVSLPAEVFIVPPGGAMTVTDLADGSMAVSIYPSGSAGTNGGE